MPSEIKTLLAEGARLFRASKTHEAAEHFRQATEIDAESELAWYWLACCADTSQERYERLLRVLQVNPNNENAKGWVRKYREAHDLPRDRAPAGSTCDTVAPGPESSAQAQQSAPVSSEVLIGSEVVASAQTRPVAERRLESLLEDDTATSSQDRGLVLVVDDSATVRQIVRKSLERAGCLVLTASDGPEAVRIVGETLPDLVLLDIVMDGMNGYDVCKTLRALPGTSELPIVMLSGRDGLIDRVRGRLAGANDHVGKPFTPSTLTRLLEQYVSKARALGEEAADQPSLVVQD